ncbi:decorin binding protein domain-containing protein [Pochonia chlamydosporia 170]|uniref:Decorin binding protein domain-containing protein n=1 Tax=Pochonia chlamydosporia 170 TaxID=1380566 RepID=A0A179EZJ5_METCM|nr:decorin binding protein domain-containing protein [Pochonia chlamydosporia 170]OAQ58588.1 decorin binding protein domain-containing protein [Pochonia chlamydosporia 170]
MDRAGDTAASRPNGRALTNQLHVNHETRRPLFANNGPRSLGKEQQPAPASGGDGAKLGDQAGAGPTRFTRRTKSDPQNTTYGVRKVQGQDDPDASSVSILSPGGSRIPRPNITGFQHRRPISLADAFKLAQEEAEEAERERQQGGSPSPAPRTWRARPGQPQDETQARKLMSEDPLDSRARARRSAEVLSKAPSNQSPDSKPTSTQAGAGSSKRTGNGPSLQDRILEWRTKSRPNSDWTKKATDPPRDTNGEEHLPELVPGIEDVPFPSVESPRQNPAITSSPLRDFTWQVDQDFTAGDLQVSDSPRIKVGNNSNKPFANRPSILDRIDIRSSAQTSSSGTRNTKLDEIRARERNAEGDSLAGQSTLTPQHARKYTRLDEIRAREAVVDKQMPLPDPTQPRPKNTKLDEIRQRETEGLSKRAIAAARLQEIKEKNAMTRSLSPDKGRVQNSREKFPEMRPPLPRPKSSLAVEGERIPDTPVTVFKNYRLKQENINPIEAETSRGKDTGTVKSDVNERDLLRRLARAASSSPAPEQVNRRAPLTERQKPNDSEKVVTKSILSGRSTNNGRKSALNSHYKEGESSLRPTVGFAGLKRISSTDSDSAKSKKSNMCSDADPTDRIEAELRLFALRDDYSEPGSVRAPSPVPDCEEEQGDDVEDTPRPERHDFLQMETPRVTGAYVETPVTVKVEKVREEEMEDIKSLSEKPKAMGEASSKPDSASLFGDGKMSLAGRGGTGDAASERGVRRGEIGSGSVATTSEARKPPSRPLSRSRSRSSSRRRPPLKNSAKPPSVKDDLRELQRQHNIDDSAMDDLEEILTGRKHASPKLKQLLEELPVKAEDEIDDELRAVEQEIQNVKRESPEDKDLSAGEMAMYDRMSKTLRTGLTSLRTAKLGIQRLEDQVAHAEKQSLPDDDDDDDDDMKPATRTREPQRLSDDKLLHDEKCPECLANASPIYFTYLHIPVPPLFHTTPRFRLTLLGMFLTVLSLWYVAESNVCGKYCRPAACTTTPCVYSYDDPTFGNALPVKLDQWTTGGRGRKLATWVFEELQDWAADIDDAVHGRSLADVAVDQLDVAGRRQHRRRLQRRGLIKAPTRAAPDQTAKWDSWRQSRLAKERSRDAGYGGYDMGDGWAEDAIGRDERVW